MDTCIGQSLEPAKESIDTGSEHVPLADLDSPDADAVVVGALRRSGFLLVRSGALSADLLRQALRACQELLSDSAQGVERHPSDPKSYRMLRRSDLEQSCGEVGEETSTASAVEAQAYSALSEYWTALSIVKYQLLQSLARGLGLEADFLTSKHATGNDSLRLLHYPPAPGAGNRCKEHSDYGTVTLLGTDGTAGLEIWDDASSLWVPVPDGAPAAGTAEDARATLVVNAGSLLSGWTRGAVRATLHRVAGPASKQSASPPQRLLDAASRHRYSMALFVDPDPDLELRSVAGDDEPLPPEASGSVADYVRWRCGVAGEGVSFALGEEGRTR